MLNSNSLLDTIGRKNHGQLSDIGIREFSEDSNCCTHLHVITGELAYH